MEQAFANAAEWDGPIVVHVLTQKGRGYAPAEEDEVQRLHDVKATRVAAPDTVEGTPTAGRPAITTVGRGHPGRHLHRRLHPGPHRRGGARPRVVALTAAMPGPTGLLAFQQRFPDRCFDVGIAEQHEVTAAAGLAMGGRKPVVAVYSTFFSRAFDQANLDVGLHHLPVVFVLDRAGITGENGPSHHGVWDLALALAVPDMTVFAPSCAEEVGVMLVDALALDGPSIIRFPTTPPPRRRPGELATGSGLQRPARSGPGDGSVCLLGVGKMVAACEAAAARARRRGDRRHRVGRPGGEPARPRDARRRGGPRPGRDASRTACASAGPACSSPTPWPRGPRARAGPSRTVANLGIPRAYIPQGRAGRPPRRARSRRARGRRNGPPAGRRAGSFEPSDTRSERRPVEVGAPFPSHEPPFLTRDGAW